MKDKIILIGGDPNSINSELIYKSWKKISNNIKKRTFIVANYNLIKKQFKKLRFFCKLETVNDIEKFKDNPNLKIIDIKLSFKNPFKVSHNEASKYIINSLNLGHKLGLRDDVCGIINCAIDKRLLRKSKIGVTEYLAQKCKLKNQSQVMLIKNEKFAVSPITTHIDLKDVAKKIKKKNIILNKIQTINKWYIKNYKKKPKIGVLGLNPHNAELRKNSHEIKIIKPTISRLKKMKIFAQGPLAADTVFINKYKKYDVIVGMYHDQVLTPFKTLFGFNAVNITLGLNYLRISPDHGVGSDIIGKNKANPHSLIKCFSFINKFKK